MKWFVRFAIKVANILLFIGRLCYSSVKADCIG